MGCLTLLDEEVTLDNEPGVRCIPCKVEVLNNHSVPEVVIFPADPSEECLRATFNDWKQFERFVASVNDLRDRLRRIRE